jgi:hypothetical protein
VRNLADGKNLIQSALSLPVIAVGPGSIGLAGPSEHPSQAPELLDEHGLSEKALIEKHLKPLLLAVMHERRTPIVIKLLSFANDRNPIGASPAASAANASGLLQTALSNARGEPCLPSLLRENAR